jgi:protein-L-isoaspartate(D-aspartate) O-methyltransferase
MQKSPTDLRILLCTMASVALVALGGRSGCTGMSDSQGSRDDATIAARQRMVREQIERRGVRDPAVLDAMARVPRHLFVPPDLSARAYEDYPLPIGAQQTISQPYIVAYMTEAIKPQPGDRVLEVGTGSGYQAAVLASIVAEVFTIEILPDLAQVARQRVADLGYDNVTVLTADGFLGWPEKAPFDSILVTAAPAEVPAPLLEQLKVGGRLVIPVGSGDQQLVRLTRTPDGFRRESLLPVRFVPMTGKAQRHI